jgi:hypothetical protein
VGTPAIPHARFTVVGAELGDVDAVKRIHHRVRVRRYGRAWVNLDDRSTDRDAHVDIDWLPVLPVIAETFDRIRVVASDDHARFAVWIDRADAAETLRVPMQLADLSGRADPDRGVWFEAGAPISVAAKEPGTRRFVQLRDTRIVAGGWVPNETIGNVWVTADGDRHPTAMEETVTRDEGETGPTLEANQPIASAPRPEAPVIAKSTEGVHVTVIKAEGEWTEVEVERPYVRVRGFVPTRAVHDKQAPIGHGSGSGTGWGTSRTLHIDVPAGACLFDAADGEVIGVTTSAESRLVERTDHPSWWQMYLGSRWGLIFVAIRTLDANTTDPAHVSVESCAH